ncbi:serine protein kinase [Aspergillus heteromorphus CBS 117.55]|uniref:non-specific serine/threonine protein kinase n=1 Tax=Aspergillus heteromorphus CBS 117.55 TaxID=1448321 RepID=A0A317WLS5_9EURO|nr:serine protein kinase [Aspergillus heteromorphus CBS 117.55]PWY87446.1 serine protein kinase [Aspergillus heteromorphus CBS 117.55]
MPRFETIHGIVEPVEGYRLGGYHPVHLGDTLDGRYEVIGKLAFGQSCTVWLAKDQDDHQVALKILKADVSEASRELSTLLRLSAPGADHPGQNHVIQLLDHFHHDGPNGTHLCLVFPAMISNGEAMTIRGKPREAEYVRNISKQILLGLDLLHAADIAHCDLQPASILFTVAGLTQNELLLQPPELSTVKWLEGVEADSSAPEYLVASQIRRGELDDADASTLLVRIGDLGGAISSRNRDTVPVAPSALRAPELIHGEPWDKTIDIWALGCLIFELATNEPLFPLGTFGLGKDQIDREHSRLINQLLGDEKRTREHFTRYLRDRLPTDFGGEDLWLLVSFLLSMLQIEPKKRLSVEKLLSHPFLMGVVDG